MRLLLDTHTLIWTLQDADRLSAAAERVLNDPANERIVSVASFWEMAVKFSIGKLRMGQTPADVFETFERERLATILPIRSADIRVLSELPFHHRDPFDRMLVAQALSDGLTLVSTDELLDDYGVTRLW